MANLSHIHFFSLQPETHYAVADPRLLKWEESYYCVPLKLEWDRILSKEILPSQTDSIISKWKWVWWACPNPVKFHQCYDLVITSLKKQNKSHLNFHLSRQKCTGRTRLSFNASDYKIKLPVLNVIKFFVTKSHSSFNVFWNSLPQDFKHYTRYHQYWRKSMHYIHVFVTKDYLFYV